MSVEFVKIALTFSNLRQCFKKDNVCLERLITVENQTHQTKAGKTVHKLNILNFLLIPIITYKLCKC